MLQATLTYLFPRLVLLAAAVLAFSLFARPSCYAPGAEGGAYGQLKAAADQVGRALSNRRWY